MTLARKESRSQVLGVALEPSLVDWVRQEADRAGQSVSGYLRELVLKSKPTSTTRFVHPSRPPKIVHADVAAWVTARVAARPDNHLHLTGEMYRAFTQEAAARGEAPLSVLVFSKAVATTMTAEGLAPWRGQAGVRGWARRVPKALAIPAEVKAE